MSRDCSPRCRRNGGLTLIEVVAGLALLASLAVGVLLAISSYRRQMQHAQDRLLAADLADRLLAGWYSSGRIPRAGAGVLSADGRWRWQTRVTDRALIGSYPVEVIRLQVSRILSREAPSVTIDLVAILVHQCSQALRAACAEFGFVTCVTNCS